MYWRDFYGLEYQLEKRVIPKVYLNKQEWGIGEMRGTKGI